MAALDFSQMPRLQMTVTSTTQGFMSLQKLDPDLTVMDLKCKFEMVTGIPAANQKLEVFTPNDKLLCELTDNDSKLGQYKCENHYRIHVTSNNANENLGSFGAPGAGATTILDFNDTSKVEKWELEDDAYDQMKGTVRDFKRKMKMGRFNAEEVAKKEAEKAENDKIYKEMQEEKLKNVKVGDRCQTQVPNAPRRLGEVKFVGETKFAEGIWAGIQYDEPVGKNDGSVKGHRYFECKDKYGGFVKVQFIECGDFLPLDDDLDLSDLDEI